MVCWYHLLWGYTPSLLTFKEPLCTCIQLKGFPDFENEKYVVSIFYLGGAQLISAAILEHCPQQRISISCSLWGPLALASILLWSSVIPAPGYISFFRCGTFSTIISSNTFLIPFFLVMPTVQIPQQEKRRPPWQCNTQRQGNLLLTRARAPAATNAVVQSQGAPSPSFHAHL